MTVEQMQLIANFIMQEEDRPPVNVVRNGRTCNSVASNKFSRRKKRWMRRISIAEWIFTDYPEEVQLGEIIHECCHFLFEEPKCILDHGPKFASYERKWLGQFGLKPMGYKKAYYTHLHTMNNVMVPFRNKHDKNYRQQKSKTVAEKAEKWAKNWESRCWDYGFLPKQLGLKITLCGKHYRIVGLDPKSYKYPIRIQNLTTEKYFRIDPHTVKGCLHSSVYLSV